VTTPPTRPEPFEYGAAGRGYNARFDAPDWTPEVGMQPVRLDPDPLTVEPQDTGYRRTGCSVFALALLAGLADILVLAVLVALIATPRSGQTTIAASRDLSELRADASAALSGAPHEDSRVLSLSGRDRQAAKLGGAPQSTPAFASGPPATPYPSDPPSALMSGLASWYSAKGDVASVPWWVAGQRPVWAAVNHYRDGRAYSVTVLVVGFCLCRTPDGSERLVDLSRGAFAQLADPSVGVIHVTMEVPAQGPKLPATDRERLQ
jgi:hypothetical protein